MMNKKIVALWLILLWSLFGLCINCSYAQEYTEADMKSVTVRFCGEGTWASTHDGVVYIEPWKEAKIRLCVSNAWAKKIVFQYGFSVSQISMGRVCDGDVSTGNKFSILIPQKKDRKITINPATSEVIEENIVIPPGMSWLQLGCLMYKLLKPENTLVGGMFNLEINKYGYLDIVVGWESDVKSSIKLLNADWWVFSTNKKVKAEIDEENNIKLSFNIENQWNISQNIIITGRIINALGFQQTFTTTTKTIAPGSKNEITADVGILPSYKGFYTINFNVKSDPQFMFPIANEKLKQPWYISDTARIFVFSWIRVAVLIVFLLVLYKLFVPRRARPVQV